MTSRFEAARDRAMMWVWIGAFILAGSSAITQAGGAGRSRRSPASVRLGPGVSNHPVGIAPSSDIAIPEGWPLGADGVITCFTCHVALPEFDGASDAKLRGFDDRTEEPVSFCVNCHGEQRQQSAAAMHWEAVQVAHVKPEAGGGFGSGRSLDGESRRCLGCHDGVNAMESRNTTPWSRGGGDHGSRTANHPVGARYPSSGSRGSNRALRPASLLPEEVRLPDGKVSCVSCHDLYATRRLYLTVPLDGSQLCFTCHAMD